MDVKWREKGERDEAGEERMKGGEGRGGYAYQLVCAALEMEMRERHMASLHACPQRGSVRSNTWSGEVRCSIMS